MTPRQGFYLFTLTKLDVRPLSLSIDDAKKLISEAVATPDGREKVRKTLQDMLTFNTKEAPMQQGAVQVSKSSDATLMKIASDVATRSYEVSTRPNWAEVFKKAHQAGVAAAEARVPVPMMVAEHESPLNDRSPIKRAYVVEGGVCGFASVHLSKANTSFASWCRKKGYGGKSYYGGWDISCHYYGQSMEKKEAYCSAFAKVLNDNGVSSYMTSRMD